LARVQPVQSRGVSHQRLSLCFYGTADVNVAVSFGMTAALFVMCLCIIGWIFKTGYRLKN